MVDGYYALETGYVPHLGEGCAFPPCSAALKEPNGLLAIGGDLSPARLLDAYRHGIFPWFSDDEPIMWWSPSPRMVLFPEKIKVARSLKKVINKQLFDIKFNTAFKSVMQACSQVVRPDQNGTWITQMMIDAYCTLHEMGYAMSAEAWQENKLVGGCYGIKIGNIFFGESMFHHVNDASKVAFVQLVQHLQASGVIMIDCQMNTPHLARFGAEEINRTNFEQQLRDGIQSIV